MFLTQEVSKEAFLHCSFIVYCQTALLLLLLFGFNSEAEHKHLTGGSDVAFKAFYTTADLLSPRSPPTSPLLPAPKVACLTRNQLLIQGPAAADSLLFVVSIDVLRSWSQSGSELRRFQGFLLENPTAKIK